MDAHIGEVEAEAWFHDRACLGVQALAVGMRRMGAGRHIRRIPRRSRSAGIVVSPAALTPDPHQIGHCFVLLTSNERRPSWITRDSTRTTTTRSVETRDRH